MSNIVRSYINPGNKLSALMAAVTKTSPLENSLAETVTNKSGSILERPSKIRFGLLKAILVVIPSIYMGGMISRTGAQLLEEHDIFVPPDDDDDD